MGNPRPVAAKKREKGDPRPMKRVTMPDGRTHWKPLDWEPPEPASGPLSAESAGETVAKKRRGRPPKNPA